MTVAQTLLLAALQGLTEFLPISSSAHLLLVPILSGWKDQGQLFDLAVHFGSLAAVLIYFRQDIDRIARAWLASTFGQAMRSDDARLGWAVLWGTVPVGLAGLLFRDEVAIVLRDPRIGALTIAASSIVFGMLLGWADWRCRGTRRERDLRWRDIAIIGCAQAFALIPGASRSGTTIAAGLMLGLSREAATRFSFLLSIPVILLATALQLGSAVGEERAVDWALLALGAVAAFASALAAIHFFLTFIERIGMQPFVLYRLALGAILIALYW
jgi:undecaprenyl-diphosphatase